MSFKSETARRLEALETAIQGLEISIQDLRGIPSEIEMEVERLKSHMISLRGFVNKKLNPTDSIEVPEMASSKKNESIDGLDSFRGLSVGG